MQPMQPIPTQPVDETIVRAQGRVGKVLRDKWRIDQLLGVGGMAAVYAATHRNKKRVALKILLPEHSRDTEIRTRFLREGYAANVIEHPGAVSVLDVSLENGVQWLRLNRPESMNAVNAELRAALAAAVRDAERSPEVRVVVVTGSGRAFCSGADVREFASREGAVQAISGDLVGTVTDASGAIVPNATVTATSSATGVKSSPGELSFNPVQGNLARRSSKNGTIALDFD